MIEYRIIIAIVYTCIETLAAANQVQSIAFLNIVLIVEESAQFSLLHTLFNSANLDQRDCFCNDFVLVFGWPADVPSLPVCGSNTDQFLNLHGRRRRGCI